MPASNGIDTSKIRRTMARRKLLFAAVTAGLAGLLLGYDTGAIAGALLSISPELGLSGIQSGAVVGAVPVGAVAGACLVLAGSGRRDRRGLLLPAAGLFMLGAAGSALAPGLWTLAGSRAVAGVGVGIAAAIAPVYIAEIAPAGKRGALVTCFQLAVAAGILFAYLAGLVLTGLDGGWRWLLGLGVLPALVLAAGAIRLPASPRWLLMQGRDREATTALGRLRTTGDEDLRNEMIEIRLAADRAPAGGRRRLPDPAVRAALTVGLGLAMLLQLAGAGAVIYYAPTIVQQAGVDSATGALLAALAAGTVSLVLTVVARRLLDRAGRRPLLLIGTGGMPAALLLLGLAFLGGAGSTLSSVLAILGLTVFAAACATGPAPVFWLLNAELYPLRTRGRAAAAGVAASSIFGSLVVVSFLPLTGLLGRTAVFWLYALAGLFTVWFCHRYVPETRGRSLEEIDEVFDLRTR